MIRIPVLLILTLLTSPLRILVTLRLWLVRRKNTVLVWTIGGGRKPLDAKGFVRLISALDALEGDPKVGGLRIEIRALQLGLAQIYTLRDRIAAIVASGTFVEVHLNSMSDRSLLLASAASRVTMCPAGELMLSGSARPVRFYGQGLEGLDISVDLESAGAYKSFGEAYTRSLPTIQNRSAMDHLLHDIHGQWVATVAAARGLEAAIIEAALAASPLSAEQARDAGIIDAVACADEDWTLWDERLGREASQVDFAVYAGRTRLLARLPWPRRRRKTVAVLHLNGPVVEQRGQFPRSGSMIASDDVVPVLDQLLEQDAVDAVVLAVNSPGGSALASDLIARRVEMLSQAKPVVAVMGNVAASGGYYISAVAREIWAHPATVTGSIGVVGGKVVLGPALARLGIQTTWMGPGNDPGMMTPEARFSEGQRRRFRASLQRVYARFIDVVSRGRGMSPEDVEPVAQGRVWTGTQALEHGLVDHLGGLKDGIARAAELAGAKPGRFRTRSVWFSPPRLAMLTQTLGAKTSTVDALSPLLGPDRLVLEALYSSPGEPLTLSVDGASWSP